MEREILEFLLDCGSMDTSVLVDIDSNIIEEAVRELKDEGGNTVRFPDSIL